MGQAKAEFDIERDTDNTFRFKQVSGANLTKYVYLMKALFNGKRPEKVTLTVEWQD